MIKLIHDYHFDEGVVENTLHLMTIISLFGNICHFVNVVGEIIGYVKHSDSSEVQGAGYDRNRV